MITEYSWLKHGDPLPEGWELAKQHISHHTHYAALIVRKAAPTPQNIEWIERAIEAAE